VNPPIIVTSLTTQTWTLLKTEEVNPPIIVTSLTTQTWALLKTEEVPMFVL
jgi:hypothetical protein